MSISLDVQKLNPGAKIVLFVLDTTDLGGPIYRFHDGTNELNGNIIWQGETYARWPVVAEGFEIKPNGPAPRPKLRVGNVEGVISLALLGNDDLVGCKVYRKRTLAQYLDAANFAGGNPSADPEAALPDDMYFIDRKGVESPVVVEWELATALDLAGVKIPRRHIVANFCPWTYRGADDCTYAGVAVANQYNQPIAPDDYANDKCSKSVEGCRLRFGSNGLRYGGFAAAGLIRR